MGTGVQDWTMSDAARAILVLTKTDTAGEVGHTPARMLRRRLNTRGCRGAILRHTDFASSIKTDDAPPSFTSVGNSADSPEPLLRPSPTTGYDAEILEV